MNFIKIIYLSVFPNETKQPIERKIQMVGQIRKSLDIANLKCSIA